MSTSVSAAPNTNIMLDGPAVADTSRGAVALEVSAPMVLVALLSRTGKVRAYTQVDADDAEWVTQWSWHLHNQGYAARDASKESDQPNKVYLHRALMGGRKGDGMFVDHINRDKLDNRRANLRIGTPAESGQNVPARSGYRGAYWAASRHKWVARVRLNHRRYQLGAFNTEQAAAEAASTFRREHMPWSDDARESNGSTDD